MNKPNLSLLTKITQRLLPVALLVLPATMQGQGDIYRADTWDFSVRLVQQLSFDINGKGGSKINASDQLGFGIDFGYNFSPHWKLGGSFDYVNPDYTSTLIPEDPGDDIVKIDHDMDMFDFQINGTFFLIDGPFTPFVKAGIGWTYVDTNVAKGRPQTGCYWDPWWGYICTTTQDSYDDWLFAYNVALGIRWEVQDSLVLTLSYQEQWLDFGNASGTPSIGKVMIEAGFNY